MFLYFVQHIANALVPRHELMPLEIAIADIGTAPARWWWARRRLAALTVKSSLRAPLETAPTSAPWATPAAATAWWRTSSTRRASTSAPGCPCCPMAERFPIRAVLPLAPVDFTARTINNVPLLVMPALQRRRRQRPAGAALLRPVPLQPGRRHRRPPRRHGLRGRTTTPTTPSGSPSRQPCFTPGAATQRSPARRG